MLVKLTASNQTEMMHDDIKRHKKGLSPHYGVYAHLLLLSERLDAIEAAATAIEKEPRP